MDLAGQVVLEGLGTESRESLVDGEVIALLHALEESGEKGRGGD